MTNIKTGIATTLSILVLVAMMFVLNGEAMAATNNLYWGCKGPEVVQAQTALNQKGYWAGNADGIFGPKTYQAVVKFQRDNKLQADGIIGPQTRKALGLTKAAPATATAVSRGSRVMTMITTGYCGCDKCNWPYGGQPSYMGLPLAPGIVAVDPNVISMGSHLYIPGYGSGLAADQGNAIKGNRLDLFFNTHQEALNWGIKTVNVTIW